MSGTGLPRRAERDIDRLVHHFVTNRALFETLLDSVKACVVRSEALGPVIHSIKSRVKDPEHLREKLRRKAFKAIEDGKKFDITVENLFQKINDLAGFRILHLYTRQMETINAALLAIFDEAKFVLLEGPIARTWDDESRAYFKEIKVGTEDSPTLYTSVHYVIKANTKSECTCEIQVRTLMEEVWGEVDHSLNYPQQSKSFACREQIKVLARVTSSCSRLVDSIFLTHEGERKAVGSSGRKT